MKKYRFDTCARALVAGLFVVFQPIQSHAQTETAAKGETVVEITEVPAGQSITLTSASPITITRTGGGGNDTLDSIQKCQVANASLENSHFGRNGPLTAREYAMAQTAWTYFVKHTQSETGLANAVGSYPSTTLWDTASYVSALVSAYELCVIDKREFDKRATTLIKTLRNLPLFQGEAPNKVYNTKTGEKVNLSEQQSFILMNN